jgi:SAM-dependent methyltransferase
MGRVAHYDGVADWYDAELADTELGQSARRIVIRLLGDGPGRLLDVGCGTGLLTRELAERDWSVTGIDISEDQLRLARSRGVDVQLADAHQLPFADGSFDAAVSFFTHTDVDDFPLALREIARVLRPETPLVYVGVHPCFVGPHSRFISAEGVPVLHPGYRRTGRYTDAPGISPAGLRARVGATHLPLGVFLQAFLEAGFRLEQFEEPGGREYPYMVALRAMR